MQAVGRELAFVSLSHQPIQCFFAGFCSKEATVIFVRNQQLTTMLQSTRLKFMHPLIFCFLVSL